MSKGQWETLKDRIEVEGFDYAFTCYSSFNDVVDAKFHELRLAFLKAREELEDYIESQED